MSQPRQILRRIQRQQRQKAAAPHSLAGFPPHPSPPATASEPNAPRTPAPAPIPTAPVPPPQPMPQPVAQTASVSQTAPVPRPGGGHALYSELMRSHDRMGTRHLDRRG